MRSLRRLPRLIGLYVILVSGVGALNKLFPGFRTPFSISKLIQKSIAVPFISLSVLATPPCALLIDPQVVQASASATVLTTSEQQLIDIFEDSAPSVAFISTYIERMNFRSLNVLEVPQGTGSGIVWDKEGHIVTNFHVIRDSGNARVTLLAPGSNGKESKTFSASVTGIDPDKDVAVLQIDTAGDPSIKKMLQPIKRGTSRDLKVGQLALAIGNPFGLDHTLTTGIISGLGREMRSPNNRPITNVIQTDASINPGNSGGPLLDSQGRLIGMNTAIYSPSGASAGIGFATPVDTLQAEVDTLIRDGRITRPAIGISYLESAQARQLGIEKGILILEIPDKSPAQEAGLRGTYRSSDGRLQLGDIIIAIDDQPVSNEADLFKAMERHQVGEGVTIKVLRSNFEGDSFTTTSQPQELTFTLKLSAMTSTFK